VTLTAAASTIPLDANAAGLGVAVAGSHDVQTARYRFVSPTYFELFDIALTSGRPFTADEARSGAPVAIVSESAARRWWPNRSAVGETLELVKGTRVLDSTARIARYDRVHVIGVVRDTGADLSTNGGIVPMVHLPIDPAAAGLGLLVRVTGEAEASRRALDRSLAAVAPGAVQEIHKLQEYVVGRLYPYRAAYWVSGVIGAIALLLTISGVYGVLAYLVAQRSKEIGIRVALGANAWSVTSLVLRQSLQLALAGLAVGVLVALAAARVFGSRVPMLQAFDPLAYLAGAAVVIVACLGASSIPALRAARLDPMTTLRAD
jgi:hypothetical protein